MYFICARRSSRRVADTGDTGLEGHKAVYHIRASVVAQSFSYSLQTTPHDTKQIVHLQRIQWLGRAKIMGQQTCKHIADTGISDAAAGWPGSESEVEMKHATAREIWR